MVRVIGVGESRTESFKTMTKTLQNVKNKKKTQKLEETQNLNFELAKYHTKY